jgi:hypothetical protein
MEETLSARSVPRLYKEGQLPLRVLRRQLEVEEVGVRWPPACEDVSSEADERPLLEDVTKQRDLGYYPVCDSDL